MSALMIQQCECGLLLRMRYLAATRKYAYRCGQCSREIELIGDLVDLHVCKIQPDSPLRDWIKVPVWRIKECTPE